MNDALRILMVTPGYPPLIGGAETHVRTLSEQLARNGHRVTVLTHGEHLARDEHRNDVHILRTRSGRWRNGADRVPWEEAQFGLLCEIQTLLGETHFDIVHGQCQVGVVLAAMLRERYAKALVATMHETEPESDPLGRSRTRFAYSGLVLDAVIAGSEFFRRQALEYGTEPGKVHLIYMGIDVARFESAVDAGVAAKRLGIPAGAPLALLLGRFKARKGIVEFIRAVGMARSRKPQLRAAIVGSGNSASHAYRKEMDEEIAKLGLSDAIVIAEDRFDDAEIPALIASADVVAQPSYREGLGLATIEAMATGVPVVASNASGIRELIEHDRHGLLVPPGDVDALANALVRLLSDRGTAQRLAAAARDRARRRFSAATTASATVEVYRAALASRSCS